jgi:hypothetical protein
VKHLRADVLAAVLRDATELARVKADTRVAAHFDAAPNLLPR